MCVLTPTPSAPAQVSVDLLLGLTSSLAKLDAKFDAKLEAIETSIEEIKVDVGTLKADVRELRVDVAVLKADVTGLKSGAAVMAADIRKLQDWKQRLWGMVLLISLVTAVAPSAWREVAQRVSLPSAPR
ncbi:hypothetical protein FIV34_13385 [Luteibacter pinisoli]|uniref:DUF1640 domain-containing protein n=1 Tax=Luteibacter pinisoli TaxID=2589080 RepID=A0A4Y5Z7H9_9GAMM|nr:hypothetical protein [Luteibacter pinisoli]QDE40138.1 hypothetical protein FIV34_13385 [Luteibacter pinisoli]